MSFISKPGRPTASRAAAISETIVQAATTLFLAAGYDGVSMEAVAARAGVPKSTLYKRYADKKALLRAVLEVRRARWSQEASASNWKLTDDLRQRLAHYAKVVLTSAGSSEVRAFAALTVAAWSQPEDAPSRLELIGLTGVIELLEHDIREFGPKQGIHAENARRVAMILMAALAGWLEIRGAVTPSDDQDAAEFAESVATLLVRGSAAW